MKEDEESAGEMDVGWLVGGVFLVCLASVAGLFAAFTPLSPTPMHQVMLAWTLSVFGLTVVPLICGVSFWQLRKSPSFGKIVLALASVLLVVDAGYLWNAHDYGLRYQGESYTRVITFISLGAHVFAVFFAALALKLRAADMQRAGFFLVFFVLAWASCPYMGEVP